MRGALRRLGFFAFTLRARLTMDFVAPGTGTTRWPATSSMQMPPLLITTALLVAVSRPPDGPTAHGSCTRRPWGSATGTSSSRRALAASGAGGSSCSRSSRR